MKKRIISILVFVLSVFIFTGCDLLDVLGGKTSAPTVTNVSIERINQEKNVARSNMYYFSPNEAFLLVVEFVNENDLVIDSISYDEYSFKNVYFEEDSTNTKVMLRIQAPDKSGIHSVTLKGFSYIVKDKIENVTLTENLTVDYAVSYTKEDLPYVSAALGGSYDYASATIQVADNNSLIVDKSLKVYLYCNDKYLSEQDLVLGLNEVKFEGLTENTTYKIIVKATIDMLDGKGNQDVTLYEDSYTTLSHMKISSVTPTQNSISFTLDDNSADNIVGGLKSIKLFKGEEEVASLKELYERKFEGLLSNTTYTLVVTYGDESYQVKQEVKTLAKSAPEYKVTTETTDVSIKYDVAVTDVDSIGKLTKIELIKGTEVISTSTSLEHEFKGLLSNTEYEIKLYYSYDLNEGNGVEEDFVSSTVKTLAKTAPEYKVTSTATQTSIKYDVLVNDKDEESELVKIEFLEGTKLISSSLDLSKEFTNLLSNTEYVIKLYYSYDLNEGNGVEEHTVTATVKTLAKTTPTYEIKDVVATQEEITFDYVLTDVDRINTFKKIELIKGEEVVKTITDTTKEFTELLSNTEYVIKLYYSYDLNEGNGVEEHTVSKTVKTLAKTAPTYEIKDVVATQEEITFDYVLTDVDKINTFKKIELIKGEEVVKTITDTTKEFTELLSNTEYVIKVYYSYDLNEGNGVEEHFVSSTVKTLAKTAPTFDFTDVEIEEFSVSANYILTDPDTITTVTKVEIYDGSSKLINSNVELKVSFKELSSYTDYTIVVTCEYDLNEGNGITISTFEYEFKTLPYFNMTNSKLFNTEALFEGDTIYLQATMENPYNASYKSVVINDVEYEVLGNSRGSNVYVEIPYSDKLSCGLNTLIIEQVNMTLEGNEYYHIPSGNNVVEVFINGSIELLSYTFVDKELNEITWAFKKDDVYALLTFDNETGYNIESVNNSISATQEHVTDLIKIDNNKWIYKLIDESYLTISSFTYSNDYYYGTKNCNLYTTSKKILMVSNDVKYVSSPEDLTNMSSYYYYELTNDIDFEGISWTSQSAFNVVIDGKGYSIKNMTYVGKSGGSGLFENAVGIIKNLHFKNIQHFTTDENSDETFGVLARYADYSSGGLKIYNCSIDSESSIIKNGATRLGGFVGYGMVEIYDSTNEGYIEGKENVAGFVGSVVGETIIENCINSGDIISKERNAAGFVAHTVFNDEIIIKNSVNKGNVSGLNAGGFLGSFQTVTIVIENCKNDGKIIGNQYAGGIIAFFAGAGAKCTLVDCSNIGIISPENETSDLYGYGVELEVINSK